MNKKFIVLMMLLMAVTCGTTVNVADKCNLCTQYKSQADCQTQSGCTWTAAVGTVAGSCGKTPDTTTTTTFIAYCPAITSATSCAGAFGCAYLDGKCTHFAGCSAYVKTTTSDCQAISYLCISNGTTCTDTLECKDYDQTTCESTPNMFKRKCKWDTTCRTYACTEADSSLTSDSACDAFSAGCVTTGAGCVASPLPNCALLPGNEGTCPNMKGGDGKCKFVSGTTCALKLCSDFPTGTPADADCIAFQSFCLKSTGKGCVATLDKCSSYAVTNAATDCAGYIGTDGVCEGDANATACRARKCENGNWCVSNGVKCVDARSQCSQYTGTTTSCLAYIGTDGKCKGLTATSGACALRDCEVDSKPTYTSDALCQTNIQTTCYSNGAGCVKTLPKCNTYTYTSTDGAECNTKMGSDFRCKAGTGGKCAARLCTDAPTSTTTTDACKAYQTGCVTTGAGCVASTSCSLTVKEKSCTGTAESLAACNWNAICVSNTSCGSFLTPALCSGYPMKSGANSYPCIWDGSCRRAVCTDYTGASYSNDTACENALSGCVYNGVSGCVLPGTCSNFKGIKATCLGFKAYCTNTDAAAATEVCIARTCNDVLTYTTDNDCTNYLTGCLTDGSGCIANTAPCASYTGTPDECDKFWGFYSSKVQNARCWNTVSTSGACTEKQCSHATTGMTQDSDCETFLKGCLFNGNGGCVTPSSSCSAYTGSSTGVCSAFKGDSGVSACWWSSGSYCTTKACSHDIVSTTDTDCNTFLSNCVTKGTGCTSPSTPCASYSGTTAQCNAYSNKVSSTSTIKCTRLENCAIKTCATKTDASSNADCLTYHQSCRLTFASAICVSEKAACASYALTGTDDAAKQTYCNQITTDNDATLCGYNPSSATACAARTCPLWVSTLTTPCVDYLGTASCRLANGFCYASAGCSGYTIATGVTDKVGWCNNMLDNSATPLKCTYVSGATCAAIATCENVISPTSAAYCNAFLKVTTCQYYGGKCYTTQTACTSYVLTGITSTNYSAYCTALKQDDTHKITWCKYGTGTTSCVAKTCSEVVSPTSQASCNQVVSGCIYFTGACYASAACASYVIPTAYSTNDTTRRLFCQNMYNTGTTSFCSYTDTETTCTAPVIGCTDFSGATYSSLAACQILRDATGASCSWTTGTICAVATQATICSNILGTVDNDNYCNSRTLPGLCRKASGGPTCELVPADCTGFGYTGTTDDAKATSCQAFKQNRGEYCSWFTTATTTCELSKDTCALWDGLTITIDNTAFCRSRIAKTGQLCAYDLGSATCRDRLAWEDDTNLQSQADCDFYDPTAIYKANSCHVPNASCAIYLAVGTTDDAKLAYCNQLANTSAVACTFIKGSNYCTTKAACTTYTVSGFGDKATKQLVCAAIPTSDAVGCTYWSGTTCAIKVACASYAAGDSADCAVQKDTTGLQCIALSGSAVACAAPANCEAITTPGSQADCDKYLTGCYFAASKCNTLGGCASYSTGSSGAIAYCGAMRDTTLTGPFCKAAADTDANCASRTCGDVSYSTHAQCKAYLSTCKSNGSACTPQTDACTAQSGNPTFCQWVLDIDGVSTCIDATPATTSAACMSRTCTQNVTETTDSGCEAYLSGCLTNGLGCIAKTEPCSKYNGTTSVCKVFTGNDIKCWGTSDSVTGPCRDRVCTDNTSATSNDECETFLTGCLTTGAGCISKSAACSSYKGTQDTCKNFTGSNKTILCFNTSAATATTSCKDRVCTDLLGTSDSDCAAFIKSSTTTPICVTNGTNCVSYPKACSDFKGTETTCPKFTATDGPCKQTNYTTTAATCTPKVCSEAPNNLITDADCAKYHPSCVTTGRGCMKSTIACGDVQTSTACAAKSSCVWANQCRAAPTSCSTLTAQGQTICVNTPLANKSMCAWTGSLCRSFLCADYDASYTTHEKCNIDTTCTTSGAGCVAIGSCSSYKTPAICAAATTSETSKRCTWTATATTAGCRARQCSDSSLTTDDECDAFLKGCKTSGTGCVGPTFGCSVFTGNQKYCIKNSDGNPCLYVAGICYDYADCGDATASTLTGCQLFNNLCVPTSTASCTAQTSCDKYTTQQSCTVGISNTVCGWLPTSKCQIFGACSDALGTSNTDCYNYGSKCVTDGVKCVDIGKCDSYSTLTSCGNAGTDGACTWVATSNSCRLRQCIDKTANSDTDCQSFTVTTGICTTDGTTCVARAACTSYGTEAACTIGSDGIPCIFSYPIGATTGTKSCRAKECSDITGASNDLCIGQIAGKACVSNGKQCVKQDACANYKNKVSCNGGGSDGICAFTAAATTADPLAGSCVAFSSCDKANNDQSACVKNTAACQQTSTISGTVTTTSCSSKTCAQAASGTTCNPVPSFDKKTYTICALVNNVCTASDPSVLTNTNCLTKSVYTYTWSESTSKCVSCTGTSTSTNNTTNTNTTTNNTNDTTTTNGYILGITVPLFIMGLFA